MMIIGYYSYKFSPEIIEREREDADNFLRKFIAKYITVLFLDCFPFLLFV